MSTLLSQFVCASALTLACLTPAHAWVTAYQPFPDGEATVVLNVFCQHCVLEDREWRGVIQDAIHAWNMAGANFTFRTRPHRPRDQWNAGDDPCNLPNAVVVIEYEGPSSFCPGDGPMAHVPGAEGLTEFRLGGARIYLQGRSTSLLIHELGHVVGLGHPDEAGQTVHSIMNSRVTVGSLQSDDIAGIQALYGRRSTPYTPPWLLGSLENPAPGSQASGIGVISGWVCEARHVSIHITQPTNPDILVHAEVPYGMRRQDTRAQCGDSHNGYGLLFNWNLLGDGEYTITVFGGAESTSVVSSVIAEATVTVTTLGEEFSQGVEGSYELEGFPGPGQSVVVEWSEALQNFVIVEHNGRTP